MATAQLKTLQTILRAAHEWSLNGQYYHINVYHNLKIGFRKPYEGYLGTEVQIINQRDRRGFVVPQMYKVLNRAGKPIFSAHRTWFTFIKHENVLQTVAGESSDETPSIREIAVNLSLDAGWDSDERSSFRRRSADYTEWINVDKKVKEIKTEINQLSELSWDQLFEIK